MEMGIIIDVGNIWAATREKLSSGVSVKVRFKLHCSATETS